MITNLTAASYNFVHGGNKTINGSLTMEQLAYLFFQQDNKSYLSTTLTSLTAFFLMTAVLYMSRLPVIKRNVGNVANNVLPRN